MPQQDEYFSDSHVRDRLVNLIVRDIHFLNRCGDLISSDDLKPQKGESLARWIVAEVALDYWQAAREPIGRIIIQEAQRFAKKSNFPNRVLNDVKDYTKTLFRRKIRSADLLRDRVIEWKRGSQKERALKEMITLQGNGELNDERWLEISNRVLKGADQTRTITSYFSESENRIKRREIQDLFFRYPVLMIPPFDRKVRLIRKGHVSLIYASYKKGKSILLAWIALALAIQKHRVVYFNLEDPLSDLEDRLDAAVSHIPITNLAENTKKFRGGFRMYRRMLDGDYLKLVDGSSQPMSINEMDSIVAKLRREEGFIADAAIVDYDDYVLTKRRQSKKEEMTDIYTDYRYFISKNNLLGWIAAQTQRNLDNRQIVKTEQLADDINKAKKVTMAIGLGSGPEGWGPDSRTLYVGANRNGPQHIVTPIVGDFSRGLFFDYRRTLQAYREHKRK